MFLLNWYREFLEIRAERACQNCEYLKSQIEIERQFNKVLFDKLINRPNEPVPIQAEAKEPMKPRFTPWRVKRQMLEQEDARAAQVLRQKQVEIAPPDDPDVKALEEEMGLIEKERENASQNR